MAKEERDVSPEAETTTPATSSKRKSAIDELEVDLAAPEPPSKRAKRALKKGKSLPKKSDNDNDNDDDLTKDDTEESKDKDKARSEHCVWVGNMPFTVTPAQLRTWFVENSGGVITEESITRIKLPRVKEPGRDKSSAPANKGFAYVDFKDLGGKVAAIALSESGLGGRKLLIKDSTSFEGRPKKEPEPADPAVGGEGSSGTALQQKDAFKKYENASRKVFVGNLSFKTTEEDLRWNFGKCGEIEFIKVATFEDTGKCKGFAWVTFKEPEAAAWAAKGFVKIKEEVETEEDFKDKDAGDESDGEPRQKQFKTRKWWVNRMLGRELRLELAEDDHTRYKKRFGKGAQGDAGKEKKDGGRREPRGRPNGEEASQEDSADLKGASDIQVARLTGAVVKPTGTKITFSE